MATHENGELDLSGEVLKTLSDICMKDVHSDVTLIVESTKIPAHKTILSARSPYFQTLFNGDFTEASKDEIELKVPFDAFKEILKYIYVGRLSLINLETELIIDMCKLAEMYNFDALNMAMSKYVLDNISINDCISTLNTACLYSMDKLQTECLKFMDCNSIELLKHEAFKTLSETSLCILLKRDTFYAPEIEIFQAIQSWLIHNPDADAKEAFSLVRLSLMTSEDLLSTVLASNILEKSLLLDVMKDSRSAVPRIPYMRENSERDLATLNIATAKNGAKVICGENPEALLNGNFTNYDFDCGSTYHVINPTIFASPYEYARKFSRHIIVDLGNVNVINFMRILLFDKDTRMYSYRVDTSIDGVQYNPLIDYKENYCRSWRSLYFSPQPVQFIRLVGNYAIGTTHSREGYTEGFFADGEGGWEEFGIESYNSFDLVELQAMYLPKYNVELIDGFMKPKFNVAKFRFDFGITVIEGGGGNNMLNDNLEDFTCHIKNCGCIMLLFNQPYQIDSIRMLLGNDKNNYNKYSFFIETSIDKENWEMAIDKRSESLSGWQMFQFEPRPASFIKITGTQNENDFICTYFECPCDPNVPIIMLKTSSFQTKN